MSKRKCTAIHADKILATGRSGECQGHERRHTLLLLGVYPPPDQVRDFHSRLNINLKARFRQLKLDDHIRLYEPSDLHVTIATLCRCMNNDLDSTRSAMKNVADTWRSAISSLNATQISLQRKAAMFEDGVGVLFWADMGMTKIEEWRSVLRKVKATVERDVNLKHIQENEEKISMDMSRFFTPDIIHSTVLRWKKTPPPHMTLEKARHQFEQAVLDTWSEQKRRQDGQTDVTVPVRQLRIVEETAPCLSKTEIHHLIELENEVH